MLLLSWVISSRKVSGENNFPLGKLHLALHEFSLKFHSIMWASPAVSGPEFLLWFQSLSLKLKTWSSAVYIQNQICNHSDETRPSLDLHQALA